MLCRQLLALLCAAPASFGQAIVVQAAASPLRTSEDGTAAFFTVRLSTVPAASVTIPLFVTDTTEGAVSPSTVVMPADATALNPVNVTVTGVPDLIDDGDQPYSVVVGPSRSTDANYNASVAGPVSVVNTDIDTAGVVITPATLVVTEAVSAAPSAQFFVSLATQPVAAVNIVLVTSDASEGVLSTQSAALTTAAVLPFDSSNWSASVPVTVTARQDSVADGNVSFLVRCTADSTDPLYALPSCGAVAVTNADANAADVTVDLVGPLAASGELLTNETGTTAVFEVVLNTQPTADVSVSLTSSDLTEGTVSPATLTFQTGACDTACTAGRAQWSTPQTVTVTGVDDSAVDGAQQYQVALAVASSDANYNARAVPAVAVVNVDDDVAVIELLPGSGSASTGALLTYPGSTATFTVALAAAPSASVTVPITSGAPALGTASPSSIVFTTTNWMTKQTVSVVPVDGAPTATYTVAAGPASSADAVFNGTSATPASVTHLSFVPRGSGGNCSGSGSWLMCTEVSNSSFVSCGTGGCDEATCCQYCGAAPEPTVCGGRGINGSRPCPSVGGCADVVCCNIEDADDAVPGWMWATLVCIVLLCYAGLLLALCLRGPEQADVAIGVPEAVDAATGADHEPRPHREIWSPPHPQALLLPAQPSGPETGGPGPYRNGPAPQRLWVDCPASPDLSGCYTASGDAEWRRGGAVLCTSGDRWLLWSPDSPMQLRSGTRCGGWPSECIAWERQRNGLWEPDATFNIALDGSLVSDDEATLPIPIEPAVPQGSPHGSAVTMLGAHGTLGPGTPLLPPPMWVSPPRPSRTIAAAPAAPPPAPLPAIPLPPIPQLPSVAPPRRPPGPIVTSDRRFPPRRRPGTLTMQERRTLLVGDRPPPSRIK